MEIVLKKPKQEHGHVRDNLYLTFLLFPHEIDLKPLLTLLQRESIRGAASQDPALSSHSSDCDYKVARVSVIALSQHTHSQEHP